MTAYIVCRGFVKYYTTNYQTARWKFHEFQKKKNFLLYWGRTTIWSNNNDGYGKMECILASRDRLWDRIKRRYFNQ
jgi:hypothetical protein